jgi:hypothetical protein
VNDARGGGWMQARLRALIPAGCIGRTERDEAAVQLERQAGRTGRSWSMAECCRRRGEAVWQRSRIKIVRSGVLGGLLAISVDRSQSALSRWPHFLNNMQGDDDHHQWKKSCSPHLLQLHLRKCLSHLHVHWIPSYIAVTQAALCAVARHLHVCHASTKCQSR